METAEWLVTAGLVVIGLMAAATVYVMRSDAEVRRYLPGVIGLFNLGRTRVQPEADHERFKDK